MDKCEKSLRDNRLRQERRNPSFSSTLLDAIYRSFDEGEEQLSLFKESKRSKQSSILKENFLLEEVKQNSSRASTIENKMEKNVIENIKIRQNSASDFDRKMQRHRYSTLLSSTSSSSDSSWDGGFSSSETESVYGARSRSRSSDFSPQRPKSIRTSVSVRTEKSEKSFHYDQQRRKLHVFDTDHRCQKYQERKSLPEKKQNNESKTKSRALKLYDDLKKVKQPISPGGRVATFLNSLFTAGNAKKAKMSSSSSMVGVDVSCSDRKSKSSQASTCSSASSFSRSCLSKTPSSMGKSSTGVKRSVRFYPVSVILDEDCRPCGHKCLYEDEPSLMAIRTLRNIDKSPSLSEELKFHLKEKSRRIEEAARDLLKGFQKKNDFDMRDLHDDEDEDDDAASCSSSDLFELDNFAAIGMERYREELPVYETTHFDTNRAIANGLVL